MVRQWSSLGLCPSVPCQDQEALELPLLQHTALFMVISSHRRAPFVYSHTETMASDQFRAGLFVLRRWRIVRLRSKLELAVTRQNIKQIACICRTAHLRGRRAQARSTPTEIRPSPRRLIFPAGQLAGGLIFHPLGKWASYFSLQAPERGVLLQGDGALKTHCHHACERQPIVHHLQLLFYRYSTPSLVRLYPWLI